MTGRAELLDHESTPSVRETLVALMTRARAADLAIANVRLGGIDLSARELQQVAYTRILLAQLDVSALGFSRQQLLALQAFTASGRLEVRCAGLHRWSPDFSVYHDLDGTVEGRLLIGAHYFRLAYAQGAALTYCAAGRAAVGRAAELFAGLWESGYDVLPVIGETIADALERADAGHSA